MVIAKLVGQEFMQLQSLLLMEYTKKVKTEADIGRETGSVKAHIGYVRIWDRAAYILSPIIGLA